MNSGRQIIFSLFLPPTPTGGRIKTTSRNARSIIQLNVPPRTRTA